MSVEVDVIWRKGDGEMPEKIKHIVNAAQDELLLRSLHLPDDVVESEKFKEYFDNKLIG